MIRRLDPPRHFFVGFVVDARDLLIAAGHDPQLGRRAAVAVAHETAGSDGSSCQLLDQPFARLIAADEADQFDLAAEAARVGCDVRSAASPVLVVFELDDWHRRLG